MSDTEVSDDDDPRMRQPTSPQTSPISDGGGGGLYWHLAAPCARIPFAKSRWEIGRKPSKWEDAGEHFRDDSGVSFANKSVSSPIQAFYLWIRAFLCWWKRFVHEHEHFFADRSVLSTNISIFSPIEASCSQMSISSLIETFLCHLKSSCLSTIRASH